MKFNIVVRKFIATFIEPPDWVRNKITKSPIVRVKPDYSTCPSPSGPPCHVARFLVPSDHSKDIVYYRLHSEYIGSSLWSVNLQYGA